MALQDEIPEYDLVKEINRGFTAVVCMAIDPRTHEEVAIKIPLKPGSETEQEAAILTQLHHESISHLKRVHHVTNGKALVFPLARDDLCNIVSDTGGLDENVAKRIIFRLLHILVYCHQKGVWHRDIKPDNILVMSEEPDNIQLCDFGHAVSSSGVGANRKSPGTRQYRAPELFLGGSQTEKLDTWSVGVTLYVIVSADFPYIVGPGPGPDPDPRAYRCIKEGLTCLRSQPHLENVSPECKDLFWRLVELNPKQRLTAREALQHQWFTPLLKQNHPSTHENPSEVPPIGQT
jgi:serine/threonine protein kinase